jgi:hypothetical protein
MHGGNFWARDNPSARVQPSGLAFGEELPARGIGDRMRIRHRQHERPGEASRVLKRSGDGTILLTVADRPGAARAGIDHQAVKDGYGVWQKQAAAAFAAAQEEAEGGVFHSGTDYTADVLYILGKYEQSLSKVPPRASDEWMWKFENNLWV